MLQLDHLHDGYEVRVRNLMLQEIALDEDRHSLYLSSRLSPLGRERYVQLLRKAAASGDDESLAMHLRQGCIAETEISHRNGKAVVKRVPVNAPETLAEGEFNRLYLRAVCQLAIEDDRTIEVYRARASAHPRRESKELLGRELDPRLLLDDLRTNVGVDTCIGLPRGPNSGLSGRLRVAVPVLVR